MGNKQGFFNCRSLFWGLGIGLIIDKVGTGFWISMILGLLMGVITLLLIKSKNNLRIVEIINGFLFTILSTAILAFMSSTLYLNETPDLVLVVVAVLGCMISSSIRNNSWKSYTYIIFCVSLFLFFTSQALLLKDAIPDNILPFFNTNLKSILYGALIFYLYSITPLIALNDISDKKKLIINYISGTLSIILISILSVLVLGINEVVMYRYPEYGLLKRIKVFEFFSNVDNLFVIIFVFDLLVTGASGIRNMKLKGKVSWVLTFFLLVASTTYLVEHAILMTTVYYYLPLFLLAIQILTLIPKNR